MKINGDCPHCKEKIDIDIDKLEIKSPKTLENASTSTAGAQTLIQETKPKEPEIKEVIKVVSPSDEPFFNCKDGNCSDKVHKNLNYKTIPDKKCKNCDSLNGHTKCKNCGNVDPEEFEEIDHDDLKELGIPEPTIPEHDHEHGD